jgi:hypothetical protein
LFFFFFFFFFFFDNKPGETLINNILDV